MGTVVGFVSLLVAGFGALAGGLIYAAVRVSRGQQKSSGQQESRGQW